MVLRSFLNNFLIKFYFRTKLIIIKGKSKIRLKKNSKFISLNGGKVVFGSGDGGLAYDKSSGINLEFLENSKFIIHGNCTIGYHSSIRIEDNAILEIGENTYISANALIRVAKKIKIGKNCAISWNLTILDSDFHNYTINNEEVLNTKEVIIGDNVWIGNNVIILKGVKIGDNSIVAAGSVVTKSIQNNSIVGGNPAKILKNNASPLNIHIIKN